MNDCAITPLRAPEVGITAAPGAPRGHPATADPVPPVGRSGKPEHVPPASWKARGAGQTTGQQWLNPAAARGCRDFGENLSPAAQGGFAACRGTRAVPCSMHRTSPDFQPPPRFFPEEFLTPLRCVPAPNRHSRRNVHKLEPAHVKSLRQDDQRPAGRSASTAVTRDRLLFVCMRRLSPHAEPSTARTAPFFRPKARCGACLRGRVARVRRAWPGG